MSKGFAARAKAVIDKSDIIVEVVDARFPQETRNMETEKMAAEKGKGLIVAINKADIAEERAKKAKQKISKELPCVFVSAKKHIGKRLLLAEIGKISSGKSVKVGILGYPNTGKSSIINMLKGRKSALTSRKAGFTRGEQLVRVNEKVMLVDTPGVIPFDEWDEFRLFLVGAKNPQDVQDKEGAAEKLVEFLKKEGRGAVKKRYRIGKEATGENVLEAIAVKRKKLAKGGKPDIEAAARIVLEDWARGKLPMS